MYFRGLGTATPAHRYTKAECLAAFEQSTWFKRLDSRAHWIARNALQRDNVITTRHLAGDDLAEVFQIDADTLARRFETHAPALASAAAARALADAAVLAQQVDAVVVSTCTGRLCPGLSGYVVAQLGMRREVLDFDLVGHATLRPDRQQPVPAPL